MDSIISLGQKNTLVEYMILSDADNRPPMLDKDLKENLINDMNIYKMKMEQFQVNTKFLNRLPPEWSKFATDVKLVKDLYTSNFDQLHAYLEQHELHANEVHPGIPAGQAQKIIPHNVAFQTEDLDTYDFNCDDLSNAQAVLMANISNYGSDVISEVPNSETYLNDMDNQSVHALQDFEQSLEKANEEQNNETITAELERHKERVKNFEQRLNIDLSSREKMIDSQMDDMIREKLALKEQVDSLEQNRSKQIKEKEYVLQTFAVFKNESKEKENKYMENEINLEKRIKELDNIVCKVGQSTQTMHMLTKPQAFYDNTHKQTLGYKNPFYLKKAQWIKPTLYDGVVIANAHVAMPMIDDEETLILEEES
ncbi:hypothetical protein Tco_1024005 [Tanacetum coccineum]